MLRTYALGRDVQWEDMTGARALVSVIGPAASELFEGPEHAFGSATAACTWPPTWAWT